MQDGMHELPINPLPAVIWLLALPIIASEAAFALAGAGFIGGEGPGMRGIAISETAFFPQVLLRMAELGVFDARQFLRLITYPFIHYSLIHAAMVVVFLLALGNILGRQFRPLAVLGLFFGSAIAGALAVTLLSWVWGGQQVMLLVGGYPAVYGLIGAFTFLIWARLGPAGTDRSRAFSLIGMLVAI